MVGKNFSARMKKYLTSKIKAKSTKHAKNDKHAYLSIRLYFSQKHYYFALKCFNFHPEIIMAPGGGDSQGPLKVAGAFKGL